MGRVFAIDEPGSHDLIATVRQLRHPCRDIHGGIVEEEFLNVDDV